MVFLTSAGFAQEESSSWSDAPDFNLEGFIDIFYVYDFNQPDGGRRQDFLFNHNRHNEFNLNLGYLKASIEHPRYRASLALQAGTYAVDNYAAEEGVMQNVYEAYAGIRLCKKTDLWLDAGIFSSHLGFESPASIDNPTLTRSLVAESSPFFLSGAKLTYISPNDHWEVAGIITNGWQRIKRVEGNSLPSFGTQLIYRLDEDRYANWSTFVGTDDPDATRRMRYFNNLYVRNILAGRWYYTLGFDFGWQQQNKGADTYDFWSGGVVILEYRHSDQWSFAARFESFDDSDQVIIAQPDNTSIGFNSISLNVDFKPIPNIACRMEARYFASGEDSLRKKDGFTNNDFFIAGSIAVRINN